MKGTSGADELVGTSGRDVICGLGGRDTLRGRGGRDVLRGGGGADVLLGGDASDTLRGGAGDDLLKGGTAVDQLACEAGFDTYEDDGSDEVRASCEDRTGNQAPVASDDELTAIEDTQLEVEVSQLLVNDADPERRSLSVLSVSHAVGGDVELDDGMVTFTPASNFCGVGGFDYVVSDDRFGDSGHVAVTVGCVNDAPVGNADTLTLTEDTPEAILATALITNDSDIESDPLTLTAIFQGFDLYELVDDQVLFNPPADICGPSPNDDEDFAYTVSDGAASGFALVDVSITCVNDPPTAVDDELFTDQDTAIRVRPQDLVSNDTDVDRDRTELAVTAVGNSTNGNVEMDAEIAFTPDVGFCGAAGFDYTVSDGTATDTGHVTVTVFCGEDTPHGSFASTGRERAR